MADIGRRATHVETNDTHLAFQSIPMDKSCFSSSCHAHDATSRSRQNRIFALKGLGVYQAARRLHEQERHPWQLQCQLVHIATQYGRQIRVNHGGVTTADHLHQGTGLVRGTDLGEPNVLGQSCGLLFMLAVTVAMQKHHRY